MSHEFEINDIKTLDEQKDEGNSGVVKRGLDFTCFGMKTSGIYQKFSDRSAIATNPFRFCSFVFFLNTSFTQSVALKLCETLDHFHKAILI